MGTNEQSSVLVTYSFGDLNVECETSDKKNKFTERNRKRLANFVSKLNTHNFNGVRFSGFSIEKIRSLASFFEVTITYGDDVEIPDSFRETIRAFCPGTSLKSFPKYDIAYVPYPIKPKFTSILKRYMWLLLIIIGLFAFTCYKFWNEYEVDIVITVTRLCSDILSITES